MQRLKTAINPGNRLVPRRFTTKAPATRRATTALRRTTRQAANSQPVPQTPDADIEPIDKLDAASGKNIDEESADTFSNFADPLVLEEDVDAEPTPGQRSTFTPDQPATIESTVKSSFDRALQNFSLSGSLPVLGVTPPSTGTQPRRPGTAFPLGLHRPLDRSLEDKIFRGEYIDFVCLLPDSLAWPQVPELQLRMEDSTPGSPQGS